MATYLKNARFLTVFGALLWFALSIIVILAFLLFPQDADARARGKLREVFLSAPARIADIEGCPLAVGALVIVQVDEGQAARCEKKLGRTLSREEILRLAAHGLVAEAGFSSLPRQNIIFPGEMLAQQDMSIACRANPPLKKTPTAESNNRLNKSSFLAIVGSILEVLFVSWGVATVALGVINQVGKKEERVRLLLGLLSIIVGLSVPAAGQFLFGS